MAKKSNVVDKDGVDQGSHSDEKNAVKPVESDVTKELKKGDEVTAKLQEQQREQEEKKAMEAQKAQEKTQVDARPGERHTHASFKALVDAYKESNPVKFAAKKERLENKLASLK